MVVIDTPRNKLSRDQRKVLASITPKENRLFSYCATRHNNYGHTCRHQIWEHAKGDYIIYVDDDDYLAHKDALRMLDSVAEPWAVFPILRHGKTFLNLPPGTFNTGTGMFIHKREVGRWPDSDSYEADGLFVEELTRRYAYQVLDCEPLVIQPRSSCGVSNAENWFGNKLARLTARWLSYRYCAKTRNASRRAKSP